MSAGGRDETAGWRSSLPRLEEELDSTAPADLAPETQPAGSRLPPAGPPGQIVASMHRRQSLVVTGRTGTEILRRIRSEDMVLEREKRRNRRSKLSIAEGNIAPLERQSKLQRANTEKQLNMYETLESNIDLLRTGPTKALWSVWSSLDRDGSGMLTRHEFNEVNRVLRVKWDRAAAWHNSLAIQQLHDLDKLLLKKVTSANASNAEDQAQAEEEDAGAALLTSKEPEISFRAFVSVYNQMIGATRRTSRQDVKTLFEDTGLRGLRREEFVSLVHRVERRLLLLPPHFEPQTDWELLLELSKDVPAKGEETTINFVQFERWWKYRCGLLEADTPVIPEFFEFKITEISLADRLKSEQQRRKLMQALPQQFSLPVRGGNKTFDVQQLITSGFHTARTGSELWGLLRKRIKMLLAMRRDWGNIDDVYGHCDSNFGQIEMKWYVRDPTSRFSMVWDILQVFFLLYVSWTVPLRSCFGIDVEWPSVAFVTDCVVDLYFFLDLIGNFFTGYYDQNGVREGRLKLIAKRYVAGWFCIDFVSCIPVDYVLAAVASSSKDANGTEAGSLRAFKTLRLVKLSKMLRLAHLQRTLAKYENLEFVQTWAGVGGLIFSIVLIAHMLTCVWYTIGLTDHFFHLGRHHHPGWVLQEYCDCNDMIWDDNPPLCDTYVDIANCPQDRCRWDHDPYIATVPANAVTCIPQKLCTIGCEERADVSLTSRYVTSMYYVIGSLEPRYRTLPERGFAIFAFVCVLIIEGAVAGVLSSILIRIGGKDQEVNDKLKAAKLWMREHRIPKDKAAKALDYFRMVYHRTSMYEESDILNTMPPDMRLDFSTQLYEKFLREVPLFRGLSVALIHSVCGIASPMLAVRQQVIYSEGSTGKEMYVLISGELEITVGGERLGFLSDGSFFGETPVLDESANSEVRRRTVTAMVDSKLCFIHKDALKRLADRYPELGLRMKRLARAEAKVNKKGRKFHEALTEAMSLPGLAHNTNDRGSTTTPEYAARNSRGSESSQTNVLPEAVRDQLARQQEQLVEQSAQLKEQKELLKTVADALHKLQVATIAT